MKIEDRVAGYPAKPVRLDHAALLALKVHPHTLEIPPMSDEEKAGLRGSMRFGWDSTSVLTLDATGEYLIEGRTRREIALDLMITEDMPKAIRFTSVPALKVAFPDDHAIHRYVFQAALARRNLTAEQKQAIVRKLATDGKSVKEVAEITGYSERRVQELTVDIRTKQKAEEQKKVEAAKANGKSTRQIAKETGTSQSAVMRKVNRTREHRGSGSATKPAILLPQRINDLTWTNGMGYRGHARIRGILTAFAKAAAKTGHADNWERWCEGLADNATVLKNQTYITVAQAFPAGHDGREFDRGYKADETVAFFAALRRAMAGEPATLEDIDKKLRDNLRVKAKLAERSANATWRTKTPVDWDPELAAKHGYNPENGWPSEEAKVAFAAEYSQTMGHVTTRTRGEKDTRARLAEVETVFNSLRSSAAHKLPPADYVLEWVSARDANRQARLLRHIGEIRALLDGLEAILETRHPNVTQQSSSPENQRRLN